MPPTAADELQTLRTRLDAIDGIETTADRGRRAARSTTFRGPQSAVESPHST